MPKVTIIGAGNVASAFGKRLMAKGCDIHEVVARNPTDGMALAKKMKATYRSRTRDLDPETDIILVAVSDDAIQKEAKKIPNTSAQVIHCSGSTPLTALPQKNRAVIWPLRSIARGQRISWKDMNMVMEADTDLARVRALDLIALFGAKAVELDSRKRKTAHLIAVILNNFSNHLLHMADVLSAEQGMDRRIFQDLMAHTLQNQGPAIESQTGPAMREDTKVMDRQLKLLKKHPHFQSVYETISKSIIIENHGEEL